MRSLIYLTGLLLSTCFAASAAAQAPSSTAAPVDTGAIRTVTAAALRELGPQIAAGIFDSVARPWSVAVPDSAVPVWRTVRSHLYALLRARERIPVDSREQYLKFTRLVVRGDSLLAVFEIGQRWRCGAEWHGSGYEYTVGASRAAGAWQSTEIRQVIAFDPPPCPHPSDPRDPGGAPAPPNVALQLTGRAASWWRAWRVLSRLDGSPRREPREPAAELGR